MHERPCDLAPEEVGPARRRWLLAAASLPCLLAACGTSAPARKPDAAEGGYWSGRLSLRVDSEPPQSFAAVFELRGAPGRGELKLSTPIGNTLGLLQWSPGQASLDDGRRVQREASIDILLTRLTGAALPVDALFGWLAGRATPVPGWRPQLDRVNEGRLQAVRESPLPRADLRLVFEPAPAATDAP
ncbi:lipoprotein insertase outer membrane protein LolB [Xenophilus arseniciresistens]|uniref:Outer-membrane lipoprotein LolB n=1 Tax=Xenophilus arseniciresistens TaxID=1283306 RepID=A0AAE3N5D7_9BURK|nr:lipoprotein insertase outer membrane protein LolB [Xenophilus arseniciresistens]MDA7415546.1 lipoprotein insertase outer membrane protein LolB [Xenophilus arseniciresistens]